MSNTKFEFDALTNFHTATAEADFLFGPEIREYIDEIYAHGDQLLNAKRQYDHVTKHKSQEIPPGYNHNEVTTVMWSEPMWAVHQINWVLIKIFRKYLDINIQVPKQPWLSKFIPSRYIPAPVRSVVEDELQITPMWYKIPQPLKDINACQDLS
jgi:hypothetical protein